MRRRFLAALALTLLVAVAYVALGTREQVTYRAEAVFYVPPNVAGQQPPGNQDAAVKLAKTYAVALPLNQDLLAAASQRSKESPEFVQSHLTMSNDAGTSLLRVQYAGTSADATAAVLAYLGRQLTAHAPPKPVTPGSIKIVDLPTSAVATGGDLRQRVPLGVSLGIVAGLALAYVLEMIRPRIDTVRDFRQALGIPVMWWGIGASERLRSWVRQANHRLARSRVELAPADGKALRGAWVIQSGLVRALEADLTPSGSRPEADPVKSLRERNPPVIVRGVHADEEGDDGAAACVVLVLRRGALRSTAVAAAESLAAQSRVPIGGVLTASPRLYQAVPEWASELDQ
jgi:capsular polysaccharide biosynthesis protein